MMTLKGTNIAGLIVVMTSKPSNLVTAVGELIAVPGRLGEPVQSNEDLRSCQNSCTDLTKLPHMIVLSTVQEISNYNLRNRTSRVVDDVIIVDAGNV
jgi:predicted molibdopterin-dependent oxidoreductase YjgC